MVPEFLKPVLRPVYVPILRFLRRHVTERPKSRAELHEYWRAPNDTANPPDYYLQGEPRSRFLLDLIQQHVGSAGSILEIGCNVGRNLHFLYQAGYRSLAGIEISAGALEMMRQHFGEMAAHSRIIHSPVEDAIRALRDREFDAVYTMAVLEHIHPDSEWIFREMVRVCGKCLITIEDEGDISPRHFPRNYRQVFEPLGLRQVYERPSGDIQGLPAPTVARVFRRD